MMSNSNSKKEKKINISIDENIADGEYSNLAIINHSNSEFIVDFISIMPASPKAKVKSRIILTPEHAKRFNKALSENIKKFEKIKIFDNELELRNSAANYYTQNINKMFISPHVPDKYYSSWAQYSILAPEGIDRDNITAKLSQKNKT